MAIVSASSFSRLPRKWGIVGPKMVGKSTFLTAMARKILIVDTEGRGSEINGIHDCEVFLLGVDDHQDPFAVSQALRQDAAEIRTLGIDLIAIDSLTPVYRRFSAEAMVKNDRKLQKNRSAAFVDKAGAIRLFQDSAVSLGTDVAFIWHYEKVRDDQARLVRKQTISEMEREKLIRSLNAVIELRHESGTRVASVLWSRAHGKLATPIEFVDREGFWKGIPEAIDRALRPAVPKQSA